MNVNHFIKVEGLELDQDDADFKLDTSDVPILALRDGVLFPGVTFPISLSRESSQKLVAAAEKDNLTIGIFCQLDPSTEQPSLDQLHGVGVLAKVIKAIEMPDGSHTAIVLTGDKAKILSKSQHPSQFNELRAEVKIVHEQKARQDDEEFQVLVQEIRDTTISILHKNGDTMLELASSIENMKNGTMLINVVCTHAPISPNDKIALLSKYRIKDRGKLLLGHLLENEEYARVREQVRMQAKEKIDQRQREYFLQAQYDTLREELYGDEDDCKALRDKAAALSIPEDTRKLFEKEVEKLSRLNPQSPDYAVQYSYLDLLTSLPWQKYDPVADDLLEAEKVLNQDHFGLEKVKERILEQLAVLMNTPEGKQPILCLVGAPGVGKTSLGQSIAKALGRKYQRVSLGGLHDEAEIRGHRRTYIGAMPGRIIDAIRRAGSSNPLLLLDEIDKTGSDFKGDPSSALLEVLDPEQNCRFHDNYVDVDYDLSHVMFIATANTLSTLSQPLLDRMEIIDISGYLLEEKVEIARRHLIPRAAKANGFKPEELVFEPEAIAKIVENYTSESGVRQLEKKVAAVVRKIVLKKMRHLPYSLTVTSEDVRELLGVELIDPERFLPEPIPGVATGLAWTAAGGAILFIEASKASGKAEKLTLTGNLGDVMKESAVIALQYVRSHSQEWNIDSKVFEDNIIHVHVPEGAIPKDGPSAGITMATAIVSALTGRPVREKLAMTGEITLRGKVLPVGGIKEKILAAKRAGINEIILCEENKKNIEDIKADYISGLTFHYVNTVEEVLKIALL